MRADAIDMRRHLRRRRRDLLTKLRLGDLRIGPPGFSVFAPLCLLRDDGHRHRRERDTEYPEQNHKYFRKSAQPNSPSSMPPPVRARSQRSLIHRTSDGTVDFTKATSMFDKGDCFYRPGQGGQYRHPAAHTAGHRHERTPTSAR